MAAVAAADIIDKEHTSEQHSKPALAWKNALAKVQAQQAAAAAASVDTDRLPEMSRQFAGDGCKNVPSILQQHTSLPNSTAPAPPRLAVMIHAAKSLPGRFSSELQRAGMYVKAAVHRRGHVPTETDKDSTHRTLQVDGCAAWNSLLTFSPACPEDMMLTLSLRHKRRLSRRTVLWGVTSVSLKEVLADSASWGERRELLLGGHRLQGMGAVLEVQLFLSTEHIEGPLSVLAATWNVGNAPPPPPDVLLSSWLRGAQESHHHLVVVGAQECNYSKELRKELSRRHSIRADSPPDNIGTAPEQLTATADGSSQQSGLPPAGTQETNGVGKDPAVSADDAANLVAAETAAVSAASESPALAAAQVRKVKSTKARVKGYLLEQVDSGAMWERHIAAALGHRYWLLCSKHMFQTRLLVFARVDVVPYISHITAGFEATGIGHVGLNKGGVAASLKVDNTRLAFISSHLAAHQSKTAQRNSDVAEICAGVHLPADSAAGARGCDIVTGFHHVVWMGDLNYRLEYGLQAITQSDSPTPGDFASLCADISSGAYEQLLQLDQLRIEQQAGRVFAGFREGQIHFAPTFKVVKGEPGFHYASKRSPAWCDRVLVKSALPHKPASCSSYSTAADISTSDHKPVAAELSLPLVTNTVASGRPTGKVPFKLYVASVKLHGASSWQALEQLLLGHGSANAAGAGVGSGEMPAKSSSLAKQRNLKLVLSGACLAGMKAKHSMKVNSDAVASGISAAAAVNEKLPQSDAALQSSGMESSLLMREENMPLLPGEVTDLQDDWLLLRVVLVEGLKQKTLLRGVVPLQPAVAEYQTRSFKPVQVPIQLEHNSAAAGTAVVSLQLISSQAARQGMYEAIWRMRELAYIHRSHSAPVTGSIGKYKSHRSGSGSESKDYGWLSGGWLTALRPLGKGSRRASLPGTPNSV